MDDYSAARWIVSTLGRGQAGQSETQTFLTKLFGSIDSYFHPANIGRFVLFLIQIDITRTTISYNRENSYLFTGNRLLFVIICNFARK